MANFTNPSKTAAVATNAQKTLRTTTASAGQAMGLLLALAYSGGEVLSTAPLTFINLSKN